MYVFLQTYDYDIISIRIIIEFIFRRFALFLFIQFNAASALSVIWFLCLCLSSKSFCCCYYSYFILFSLFSLDKSFIHITHCLSYFILQIFLLQRLVFFLLFVIFLSLHFFFKCVYFVCRFFLTFSRYAVKYIALVEWALAFILPCFPIRCINGMEQYRYQFIYNASNPPEGMNVVSIRNWIVYHENHFLVAYSFTFSVLLSASSSPSNQ